MTSHAIFQSLTGIATIVVGYSVWFALRYGIERIRLRRLQRQEVTDWDQVIASLKLRLPRNAEFAVLEHQMWFSDDRNRQAAKAILAQNGFETSETETYEKGTRYWLLVWRSAVFDNVKAEIGKVVGFVESFGGRYTGLGLHS